MKPLRLHKEDIDLIAWEFEAKQRSEQPILLSDIFSRAIDRYFTIYISGNIEPYGYLFTDSNRLYRNVGQSDRFFKMFIASCENQEYLKNILRQAIELPQAFNREAEGAMIQLRQEKELTDEVLARYWKAMDEAFLKVIPWFWYPWYLAREDVLTLKVKAGLSKFESHIQEFAPLDDALLAVVFPTLKTNFQLEQSAMDQLVAIAERIPTFASDPEFKAAASDYLQKYDWLTTFIMTPLRPMTYDDLLERVRIAQKEGHRERFKKQEEDNAKKTELASRILDIVKDDSVLVEQIAHARELGYVLTAGIEEAYMATSKYLELLDKIADSIGIAYTDTKYLLSSEIISLLQGDTNIADLNLDERRLGFTLAMIDSKQYVAYGTEGHALSLWIDETKNAVDHSITEFKGQIASKGYAKGRALVAGSPVEAHTLKDGEILICAMTNPDYVPAMRRSGAIVTDEGGLLSHAAIMSREFNKPCVIATKIATELIKTGDLVEVDADRCIVRILERKT